MENGRGWTGEWTGNGPEMDWRVVELALFSRHHVGSAVEHAPLVAGERMDASLDGKARTETGPHSIHLCSGEEHAPLTPCAIRHQPACHASEAAMCA